MSIINSKIKKKLLEWTLIGSVFIFGVNAITAALKNNGILKKDAGSALHDMLTSEGISEEKLIEDYKKDLEIRKKILEQRKYNEQIIISNKTEEIKSKGMYAEFAPRDYLNSFNTEGSDFFAVFKYLKSIGLVAQYTPVLALDSEGFYVKDIIYENENSSQISKLIISVDKSKLNLIGIFNPKTDYEKFYVTYKKGENSEWVPDSWVKLKMGEISDEAANTLLHVAHNAVAKSILNQPITIDYYFEVLKEELRDSYSKLKIVDSVVIEDQSLEFDPYFDSGISSEELADNIDYN